MQLINRSRAPSPLRLVATCIALLGVAGCGDDAAADSTQDGGDRDGGAQPMRYRAQVRWTSYGIPHFVADDMPSVAYASGYVTSKDTVCILADQFVRLRSERARYFGPGEEDSNINSDFGILTAGVRKTAMRTFPKLDAESHALVVAYAAGYNRYLDETPHEQLPEPCRGAKSVKPIEPEDLWTYYYYLSMGPDVDTLFERIGSAAPPADASTQRPDTLKRWDYTGGNSWAIGKDKSENGHGMLLANPHLPWQGPRRLYEQHITVRGATNVYGAGSIGMPVVAVGFNEDVAFTHSGTLANHVTAYQLELAPGNPTHYMFDGEESAMSKTDYAIDVKQPDGSVSALQRTLYRSRYGPMLGEFRRGMERERGVLVS